MLNADTLTPDPIALRRPPSLPGFYAGPERRSRGERLTQCLSLVLDEMAHGVLLVSADGLLRHANQPARTELGSGGTLQLLHGRVAPSRPEDLARFLLAVQEASTGRRRLFSVGDGARTLSIAAVPLAGGRETGEPLVLLVLGRRQHVEALTIDFYARTHGLTAAEANVLRGLCRGLRPKEVARDCGVAVSTVRTQITSIRQKTQSQSIRALLERVAALPPINALIRPH